MPRVVAPLAVALGRPVWSAARCLEALQWRSAEELESRAVLRLRALAAHAARHVPFYRDLFTGAGFDPDSIRTIQDLARLPISTKIELRSGFPDRTTASNIPTRRWRKMKTSGSTGRPFEFYWDRQASALLDGTYLFWLGWAGTAIWHTRIVIASPSYFYHELAPPRRLRQIVEQILMGERTESLPSDQLTTEGFRTMVGKVSTRGPYFLRGYPRAIAGLAAGLAQGGIALPRQPKVVMTLAETLTPANVEIITRVFQCPVVNYFSAWEVPQIAQTCPDNPETLHVNAERVVLRVVRPDGTDAAPGETGTIVLTDLANFVMPFINYSAGDQAVAGGRCPCGRGLPTLARLEGRDSEVIRTIQGREISGTILGSFLSFVVGVIPYVWEYQAVQTGPAAVTLRVVPTSRFDGEYRESLERALGDYLGPGMAARVEAVREIPLEPSGKRLIIKPLPAPPS